MKQLFSLLVLAAAVCSGCAVGTEQEPTADGAESLGEVDQAFLEAACPTLTPDAFVSVIGHFKTATTRTSGTNYGSDSRCKNAFKVNVRASGAPTASVYAYWQSPFPQSETACLKAAVFLRVFEKVGASYVLRSATSARPSWDRSSCNGLFAWSDIQNIGNGHDWMAIAEGLGSDGKLRPLELLLYSN